MKLHLFIARRYLCAPKRVAAIHIIAALSVCGVALATMAMVCTLSVFNGFENLVATCFTAFDPELKITATTGKTFSANRPELEALKQHAAVAHYAACLEEHALLRYHNHQQVVTLKGVTDNYPQLTAIDSTLIGGGEFRLHNAQTHYGVFGIGVVSALGMGISPVDPIEVYLPSRTATVNMANMASNFAQANLYASGLAFMVGQQPYDTSYVLTSLSFMQQLLNHNDALTSVEVKLHEGYHLPSVKRELSALLGSDFLVHDRYEQQADVFRLMEIEKWVSYCFLTFIMLMACFSIVSTLSMLIIDKEHDIFTLRCLGGSHTFIRNIFFYEGVLIAVVGALIGTLLGLALCFLQAHYGWLTLGSEGGAFMVDAYPVQVKWSDVGCVVGTVVPCSTLAIYGPVRALTKWIK